MLLKAFFLGLLCTAAAIPARVASVRPFWNAHAKQFMFPPAFDLKTVEGATSYRFTLSSRDGTTRTFEAAEPWAPLTPIWGEIPSGRTELRVDGLKQRGGGEVVGTAGILTFHRAAPFNGPYGKPVLPYDQSARVALASVMAEPFVKSWRTSGKPDPKYALYRYASKVIGSLVSGCAMHASPSPRPDDADEAIDIGRRAADFLISISHAPGTAL